jgi:hypothetical protein
MKLIYCPDCKDMVKMDYDKRTCKCGDSWGYYESDGLNAKYGGKCIPIGISNPSLHSGIIHDKMDRTINPEGQYPGKPGIRVDAFIIPECAPTVERLGEASGND